MNVLGLFRGAVSAAAPYRLYAELALAGVLVAACGTQTVRLALERGAHARDVAAAEHTRAVQLGAALEETEKQRLEFERRTTTIQKVVDETTHAVEGVVADAAAARDSRDRLLARVAALTTAAREASRRAPAARGGAPTEDPIGVLADVLGRADARAGLLAQYADRAHTAGLACERSYDALTK